MRRWQRQLFKVRIIDWPEHSFKPIGKVLSAVGDAADARMWVGVGKTWHSFGRGPDMLFFVITE